MPESERASVRLAPLRVGAVQFWRFIVVGCGSFLTDFGAYCLLTKVLLVHPLIANPITRTLGGLFSFAMNKRWTFGNHGKSRGYVQFGRFWVVWVMSFALSESLIWLFYVHMGVEKATTKVFAEGITGVFTFLCHRYWTFK